ncbi:MAG TPA: endonuclease/exonuclease/phosphatase family protein [Thermomicrobiales bacterium]
MSAVTRPDSSLFPHPVAAPAEASRSSRPRRWRQGSFWRPDTAPHRHVETGGPVFTVMTYNLGNGLAEPDRLVSGLRASTADLIGLQELESSQAEAIAGNLGDLFPHQILHPAGFAGKGLLSRYAIIEQEQLHFSPDRPDLRVVIDLDGLPLTVIVAHPRPPQVRLTGVAFDPVTTDQIEMLAEIAVASGPAVVVGDFNMTVRHARYADWTSAGLIDAFRAIRRGGATLPVRVGRSVRMKDRLLGFPLRPVVRVDYIWHTAHLAAQAAWVGDDAGSDHLPVLARLVLKSMPAPG